MSKLFSPIQLRELSLSNRVMVSPMCQYSALEGAMQEWHRVHLGQMAQSGAGLVMVEATSPTPEGRITHGCVGLWDDRTEAAMASVMQSIRATSAAKMAIQIGHAGRKASSARPWEGGQIVGLDQGGWQTLGPSPIAHMEGETVPHELSLAQLRSLTEAFLATVARAERLGFDAIELHAAHGYLLHEFLSPIANQRQDAYGGSLENRMRFPLQLFTAMRAAWPAHKPMGLRLSATDWVEGSGWDIADACEFARRLEYVGADWIDVSSGGVSRAQQIKLGPGYQVAFAGAIKAVVQIPVIAVGLITEAKQAEAIIENKQADMVALGRGFLWDPHWAWKAAAELGASIAAPRQYWRSNPAQYKDVFGSVRFGAR
ncbi:MAG: NADH:flavin oxidoreductase/NADH oxidase [Betaproteobacteria bacterium]